MKGLCLRGEQRNQQNQTTSAVVCLSLCMGWGEVGRGGVRWVEAERGGVGWDWLGGGERELSLTFDVCFWLGVRKCLKQQQDSMPRDRLVFSGLSLVGTCGGCR